MRRERLTPRENWQSRLEEAGCYFHTIDGKPYWTEDAAYVFDASEIDAIETATQNLHEMCLDVAAAEISKGDFEGYGFPDEVKQLVTESWRRHDAHLFGRFDLGYDGKQLKMFEYNADTPTALPEAAIWQWHAKEDRGWSDQFNSIHERLVGGWQDVVVSDIMHLHFIAQGDDAHEDWGNLHYLLETASEAGRDATSMDISQIGHSSESVYFVDGMNRAIRCAVKLYPWEFLMADEFGWHVRQSQTTWINPPWTMLLSTKALLPKLWTMFPGHPLLLETHFDRDFGSVYVRKGEWCSKPLLGREGANVTSVDASGRTKVISDVRPEYNKHGYVYQAWFNTPEFDGKHPVIGSWIINGKAAGIGIRDDSSQITTNASCFVPHYFR